MTGRLSMTSRAIASVGDATRKNLGTTNKGADLERVRRLYPRDTPPQPHGVLALGEANVSPARSVVLGTLLRSVLMGPTCECGHPQSDHERPGSTACTVCECLAFEERDPEAEWPEYE